MPTSQNTWRGKAFLLGVDQKRIGVSLNRRVKIELAKTVDHIIDEITSKRVKKNQDQIRSAIKTGLDETQIFLIQSHLNTIDGLTKKLDEIDSEIKHRISERKNDMQIAMSVPGIGFKAAATILAEIGIVFNTTNLTYHTRT
jgi:transposase